MKELLIPFLAGLGAGVLSAWGVGGGTILLLCMTLLLGVDQRQAQAVNLLFFLPAAGAGLLFHRKKGEIDGLLWRQTALAGTAAALAAAAAAQFLDVSLLRRPFGVYLLLAGLSMLRKLLKKTPPDRGKPPEK